MTGQTLELAGEFPPPTLEQWQAEVLKVMNRRRPPGSELTIEQAMKRLTTHTVDGLTIDPLYTQPDNLKLGTPTQMPFTRGSEAPNPTAPWVVEQLHEDPDVARSHTNVMDDLNRGGTGVWLRVDPDAIAAADLAKVLAGVVPGAAQITVSSVSQQSKAAQALLDFLAAAQAKEAPGNLGIDPLGSAAVTGAPADLSGLAEWVAKAKAYAGLRALVADVTPYDNAGAGDVEQLALAIATGIEYVRALAAQGVSAEEAFGQIVFRVAATADQFGTICRLRALRRLWARVGDVLDVPEAARGAIQHSVTSWRIISRDDPWVNLLRATISSFSAAVGGAEIITTLPHDAAYGLPTEFSRRIARNIQLLAAEESHVGAVKDPAGGAWYVEALTDQMAVKAWALVQEIEAAGGMAKALASGLVAQRLATVATARAQQLATRKLPLTGVSMFPKQDEEPLADFIARPARPAYKGLPQHRDPEIFEALRDRARAYAADRNTKPAVLLACLGERRDFGGREMFTSNVLWVGGIDTPEIEDATPEAIAKEATKGKYPVVVLASSAKIYADQAMPVAEALKKAGVPCVCIAGRRTETGADNAAEYIDQEIFDGMDVVAFLSETLDRLEAQK